MLSSAGGGGGGGGGQILSFYNTLFRSEVNRVASPDNVFIPHNNCLGRFFKHVSYFFLKIGSDTSNPISRNRVATHSGKQGKLGKW